MRLFMVAPMFTRAGEDEIMRRDAAWKEWWKTNGDELIDRYQISSWNLLGLLPGKTINVGREHKVTITLPDNPNSIVQKGLAVRFSILAALDWADRQGIEGRRDVAFGLIDGSGAFDFENIRTLLDTFVTPPQPDVVLGCRPSEDSGMEPWRKAVEIFENGLILQRVPSNLRSGELYKNGFPDGQAGCWAIRMSALKNLPLSANKYDIEFDLLASSVIFGLRMIFTKPLIMKTRNASEFGSGVSDAAINNSMEKLEFIQYKLGLSDDEILQRFSDFLELCPAHDSQIPDEYRSAIETKFRPITGNHPQNA